MEVWPGPSCPKCQTGCVQSPGLRARLGQHLAPPRPRDRRNPEGHPGSPAQGGGCGVAAVGEDRGQAPAPASGGSTKRCPDAAETCSRAPGACPPASASAAPSQPLRSRGPWHWGAPFLPSSPSSETPEPRRLLRAAVKRWARAPPPASALRRSAPPPSPRKPARFPRRLPAASRACACACAPRACAPRRPLRSQAVGSYLWQGGS